MTKISGIKKAVGEFNRWTHGGARIYMNTETGEVWTDIYPDGNSWTEYHNEAIIQIMRKGYSIREQNNKTSMKELLEICESKMK